MDTLCPSCRSPIALDDINVSTDIALCRRCSKTFHFSRLVDGSGAMVCDLNSPPKGAWYELLPGGFRAGASTRSWAAIFLVPFTCVWAGGSMSGIYGTQIIHRQFNPFASLFGIPFAIGTVVLISTCAMMVAGRVEVVQSGDALSIFTGVGALGWKRTFSCSDFSSACEERAGNRQTPAIVLEGAKRVKFGSGLNQERRYFLLSVLRQAMQNWGVVTTPIATASRF
jgi:hypothetical protein